MTYDPADPHVLAPDQAPTPFTADEIRRGCPAGRTIRLLVEGVGEAPSHRVNRFVRCDDSGATIERARLTVDGEPLDEPEVDEVTWADLQRHASFPADRTSIRPETLETPMGREECLRYTVTDGSTVQTFWFATGRPGMPIRFEVQESGETLTSVSVLDDTTS
jgi:hypothetical protein